MFSTPLILEAAPDPDFWILRGPLVWCDPIFGRIVAPVGFRTDLASIPRTLRNLPDFDPNGRSRRAAVMHDWLYSWQGLGKDRSDDFLRAAMVAEGCSAATAEAFHDAVKWFGHYAWTDDAARGLKNTFVDVATYTAWSALQP